MKTANRATREAHVMITPDVAQSAEFKNYLAVSRDSYPMGLGRLVAIAMHELVIGRRQFSRYEMDRIVQWPADRKLDFAQTLEVVGWARAVTNTLYVLELPPAIRPRKPYRDKPQYREIGIRNEKGQVVSKEEHEKILMSRSGVKVLTVDMDGVARTELDSVKLDPDNQHPKARRRHKHGPLNPANPARAKP